MAHSAANCLPTIARHLWAGPVTLLGLLAAAASLSLPRVRGSILISRSGRGFAYWFLTRRGYSAITLGHLVLMTPMTTEDVLSHEMVHVRQTERWGPLFPPAYLAAMLLARSMGKDPYWDNPFEVEARSHPAPVPVSRSEGVGGA